jgi:hypothetical protein
VWPLTDHALENGIAALAWYGVEAYNFVTHSDARSKRDVAELPAGCLALVEAIAPKSFRFRGDVRAASPESVHWGFVAQEVGAAMAAAGQQFGGHLIDPESGRERLRYNDLLALLWRAVQELAARGSTPAGDDRAARPAAR